MKQRNAKQRKKACRGEEEPLVPKLRDTHSLRELFVRWTVLFKLYHFKEGFPVKKQNLAKANLLLFLVAVRRFRSPRTPRNVLTPSRN